jgi:hypothetical protein
MMSGDASFIQEDYKLLRKISSRGVKIKVIISESHKNKNIQENINKLIKAGAEVRAGYSGSMRGSIIDKNTSTMVFKTGNDELNGIPGSDRDFKYELLIIDNPNFVRIIREYFDFFWENADALQKTNA